MSAEGQTALVDRDRLVREYGLGPRGVESLFRALPNVCMPGYRRVFLWRSDVDQFLRDCTLGKSDVVGVA